MSMILAAGATPAAADPPTGVPLTALITSMASLAQVTDGSSKALVNDGSTSALVSAMDTKAEVN